VLRPSHVIESGLEVLESIKALANNIGLQVFCGELEVTHRLASEDEANALRLELPVEVMHVARVILAENRPVAFLVDILPENIIAPGEVTNDFTGSVLDLLLRRDDPSLINSRCEIGAVAATSDLARALNIRRGDALLRFISRLYALDGTVVDYSFSYFIPGFFRFHVVRELAEG
jgi:GntR family transcriptional regulator